ncbi:MAG: CHAP domain-containing protein, partial [Dehalococcoidia bacterium]
MAKQYLGTYQGDCWPFVKKVVLEATGGQMGFGYIQAFLDAGGYEVPISEARNGDIVQVVDDDDAGPGADHPGLHTAIIVEVNPDGTFLAIDSNQKWDGIVRWRPNYDPALRAAQMGINVHVFRFGDSGGGVDGGGDDGGDGGSGGGGGPPAPSPTPDGSPAIVSADGDGLRLRSAPSL